MRTVRHRQQGFTAVELLITLFVAAGFLVAGYQLYFVVIKDNGNTRAQARAANIAYNVMRQYAATVSAPCSPGTPLTNSPQSVAGLTNVQATVTITCPYSTSTGTNSAINISRVEVSVSYNNPSQTVRYVTYTHDTPNTATSSEITNGLVAWWKLNGNAQASIGQDGTVNGATPTTGQGGVANTAYSFNGTSNSITSQITNTGGDYIHTMTYWIKPTSVPTNAVPFFFGNGSTLSGSWLQLTTTQIQWKNYNSTVYYSSPIASNQWTFIALTYASGGSTIANKTIYINGTAVSTLSTGSSYGAALTLPTTSPASIGYTSGESNYYYSGAIDDVRVYNRVLSAQEVETLYNNGAQ